MRFFGPLSLPGAFWALAAQAAEGADTADTAAGTAAPIPTPDQMQDILDIEGPVRLPFDWTPVWWAVAAVLALGIAIWLFLRYRRRRARRRAQAVSPPPSPYALFEMELAALSGLGPGRAREFSFRLSAGLRGLIEAATGMKALEMTTEELVPRLAGLGLARELRRDLVATLTRADMVKFAGAGASAEGMRADLDCGARLFEAVRPAPEAPPEIDPAEGSKTPHGDGGPAVETPGGGGGR